MDDQYPNRFRITSPEGNSFELACTSDTEAGEWGDAVRENIHRLTMKAANEWSLEQFAKKERLCKELSDIIIYCQTVEFDPFKRGPPAEMSSLGESTAEKYCSVKLASHMNHYNKRQLCRVYPKGKRLDSSNYNPTSMWNAGCQLVALNFQTPDLPMQLNHARFLANGGCGYILKPEFMSNNDYNPYTPTDGVDPVSISITVLGARHLPTRARDIPSPLVEIDIHGCPYDSEFSKSSTSIKSANGLNLEWHESSVFDITNPDVALIRFAVYTSDIFGDSILLAQATYPVKSLRNGYRSVPLKNNYSEEIPLAALLIHLDIGNPEKDYQEVYTTIQNLHKKHAELEEKIADYELTGNQAMAAKLRRDLASMKRQLNDEKHKRDNKIKEKKKKSFNRKLSPIT